MRKTIDFQQLKSFFPQHDIEWKPLSFTKDRRKALAAAYVTNRAIMDRLDLVCGPENWQNAFRPGPDGGVLCGLSIRIGEEWVTKWDGAENTDIEPVKGGLSSSMRRAAVQWGIGRYLYDLPTQWAPVDGTGRFAEQPVMPAAFLPAVSRMGDGAEKTAAHVELTVRQVPDAAPPLAAEPKPTYAPAQPPAPVRPLRATPPEEKAAAPISQTEKQGPRQLVPRATKRIKPQTRSIPPDAAQYFMPGDLPF